MWLPPFSSYRADILSLDRNRPCLPGAEDKGCQPPRREQGRLEVFCLPPARAVAPREPAAATATHSFLLDLICRRSIPSAGSRNPRLRHFNSPWLLPAPSAHVRTVLFRSTPSIKSMTRKSGTTSPAPSRARRPPLSSSMRSTTRKSATTSPASSPRREVRCSAMSRPRRHALSFSTSSRRLPCHAMCRSPTPFPVSVRQPGQIGTAPRHTSDSAGSYISSPLDVHMSADTGPSNVCNCCAARSEPEEQE